MLRCSHSLALGTAAGTALVPGWAGGIGTATDEEASDTACSLAVSVATRPRLCSGWSPIAMALVAECGTALVAVLALPESEGVEGKGKVVAVVARSTGRSTEALR